MTRNPRFHAALRAAAPVGFATLAAVLTLGLTLGLAMPAMAQKAPPPKPIATTPAATDPRAALRAEIAQELALLRPRLKAIEEEAKEQAERYKEMAASKAEAGKKSQERAEAARERADKAAARQGYKPKVPGAGKKAGNAAAAGAGAGAGAPPEPPAAGGATTKKLDPVLTQQYVVLQLRDQIRQLRQRIDYLESVQARLDAKS